MSSVFKTGDQVIIIAGPHKGPEVHTVQATTSRQYPLLVGNGTFTAEGAWYSTNNMVCLRHATAEEIAAMQKPKPIRRGDLVMCRGQIGMVHDIDNNGDNCWIAMLTGNKNYYYTTTDGFIRIGSIRKKVKQLRQQFGGEA